MLVKIRGIVINKINYSDTSQIVKIYTNAFGMQSYIINGVKGNKGSIRQSHLLTLNLLDMEVYHQQNKNLQRIKEVKCNPVLNAIHNQIIKSSIALFISEILYKTLKHENIADENLFTFLEQTIQFLEDTNTALSSFHLWFLVHYCSFLGFKPQNAITAQHKFFSLTDGCFKNSQNQFSCSEEISHYINELIKINADEINNLKISPENRIKIYEDLLKYYQLHDIALEEIHSYKIIKQIFE